MIEDGLDVVGFGKLAKAIPQKVWNEIVNTACTTFRDCVAPVTATASGLGRLITAKFDKLADAEKVLVSENFEKANVKIQAAGKQYNRTVKSSVLTGAIEGSANETDEILRELWSNLIAQEIAEGSVHPEFVSILKRMSAEDVHRLVKIAEEDDDKSILARSQKMFNTIGGGIAVTTPLYSYREEPADFICEHLAELKLIQQLKGLWILTHTGKAFIVAVSDVDYCKKEQTPPLKRKINNGNRNSSKKR